MYGRPLKRFGGYNIIPRHFFVAVAKKCVMVMIMAMKNLQCNGNLISYFPE